MNNKKKPSGMVEGFFGLTCARSDNGGLGELDIARALCIAGTKGEGTRRRAGKDGVL